MKDKKYININEVVKKYPFLGTKRSIQHLMTRNINNIRSTTIKIGGKILINVEEFETWIDNQRQGKK